MRFIRYFVAALSFGLCLYHSYTWRFNGDVVDQVRASGRMSTDGMWEIQLVLIHMGLSALFLLMTTSAILVWRFARQSALLIGTGILSIYGWWYYERYVFLRIVYELRPDSAGADSRLAEIGFLIGATRADYFAFVAALIVVSFILTWSFVVFFQNDKKAIR